MVHIVAQLHIQKGEWMKYKKYDIIEQIAFLWKLIYYQVLQYKERHKDWLFVRHEDLSLNPEEEFANIFQNLDLNFTTKIKNKITVLTNSKNPVEAPNNKAHYLRRNSTSLVKSWTDHLTNDEVMKIKDIVWDISKHLYTNDEW